MQARQLARPPLAVDRGIERVLRLEMRREDGDPLTLDLTGQRLSERGRPTAREGLAHEAQRDVSPFETSLEHDHPPPLLVGKVAPMTDWNLATDELVMSPLGL
jgi:hypothetical protein